MKAEIHPAYGPATIRCACGNVIETRSTQQGDTQVEICSACHPFFTGKQKLMDTTGRIDRFKKKFGNRLALGSTKGQKRVAPTTGRLAKKAKAAGPAKATKPTAKPKAEQAPSEEKKEG